jgi:hypothetical protein
MKLGLLFVAALVLPCAAFAQEFRGTFSGAVTDAQGAGLAKAKIVVTETQTGVKSTAVAELTGEYTIPFLSPGIYEITAEAPGFKKSVRRGITLSAGAHPIIDIRMEIGSVSDSITVTADAPLLVLANPSVGQVITTAEVDAFPINGRTPMMLDNLALGVISTFEPGPVRPFDNGAPNQVSIGGAPTRRNEVLLNGAPNAGFANDMAYSPPSDSVTEVRVNVFEMDAAIGHSMGGSINLVTKGGTNSLHGSAYIFNQTSVFDANSFFNNAHSVARPSYHQNQYGFTVGGPLVLPKIYNGRNRVFWFYGQEGMRDSDPANSPLETGNPENFTSVPTVDERKGDFSALLKVPGNNNYTIYDPKTGVLTGNLVSRQPFGGNIIPPERLNEIAKKYLNFFPLPNTAGQPNGSQNYLINAIDFDSYDNEIGRLDLNLSNRHKLSFDARHNYRAQNKNDFFHNPATGNFLYRVNQGGGMDYVYTISPTVIMNIRGNWTRYIENHSSPADSVNPDSLGFPSYLSRGSEFPMLPFIVFTGTGVAAGARSGFEPLGYNGDGTNYSDSFQLFGTVVKVRGNHTFKAGGDGRVYRWSIYNFGNPAGTFTFCCNSTSTSTSTWMNNPAQSTASAPFGQDLAAFLLGLPSSGSFDLNSQSSVQSKYLALFVQDDWRVRSNLTINLGLRWDHDFPETERYNRLVNGFDPTAPNPISAAAAAAYNANPQTILPASQFQALGGLTFATPGHPFAYRTRSSIVSPRVGFAWTPAKLGSTTAIRGGFGVFVDPVPLPSPNQQGFSQQTTFPTTANFLFPPVATLSDPFPNGFVAPSGSSKGTGTFLGQALTVFNPNISNAYSLRWDLSVQRLLPGQMVLEVAYIGNHGVHLPINTQLDYVPRQYLSTSLTRDSATINRLTGTVPNNPFKGLLPNNSSLNGSTIALQQLLIPFPQYPVGSGTSNGVVLQQNSAGSSYFQSLNVRLQKRFTHGLTLLNNFIYNKLIDRLAYLNDSDPSPEKRLSGDSRPLRNVLASTYQLPIGRGRWMNLQSRWMDSLVGGWGISGILTLQSGPTLSWGNYIYYGGPLNLNPHQPDGYAFDITQFNTISNQQLGSNIRTFDNQFNNLRRDMVKQLDASLTKNFGFGERRYVQVRFEAFNLTNRVTFGNPQTNPTNSAFGTIGSQANTPRRIESALRLVF